MKDILKLLILLSLFFLIFDLQSQVLNIENERIVTDTTGWAGSTKLTFDYSKNTLELWKGGANLHLQYKTEKSLYLGLGEYRMTKGSGTEFENAATFHLRYNYKFLDWLTGEVFTQSQFNKMLKVDHRWLTGAGPRFKVIKTNPFRLYCAALYMYEYEELKEFDTYNRDHRVSSYVSFSLKLGSHLSLTNTTYYQPKIKEFKDFRLASQTNLNFKISKHVTYILSYHYFFDRYPAPTVPNETQNISNSLMFSF